MREKPIGIFDSGIGGLTVAKMLAEKLPNENLLYLGDTARVPYGTKSKEVVQRYAATAARFLAQKEAKIIVVACNTATAYALDYLREKLDVPVIGVIEPGAFLAAKSSKNGHIGVIGTEGTIQSGCYTSFIHKLRADAEVKSIACPLFVPLAEEGLSDHPATLLLAEEYLAPMRASRIDTLILGCTHYPILRAAIEKVIGDKVQVIDSAHAVAAAVAALLQDSDLAATARTTPLHRFYVTDLPARFLRVGKLFFSGTLSHAELIDL